MKEETSKGAESLWMHLPAGNSILPQVGNSDMKGIVQTGAAN